MTKDELIKALEPFPGDIELIAVNFYEEFYFPTGIVTTFIMKGISRDATFTSEYVEGGIEEVEKVLRLF